MRGVCMCVEGGGEGVMRNTEYSSLKSHRLHTLIQSHPLPCSCSMNDYVVFNFTDVFKFCHRVNHI